MTGPDGFSVLMFLVAMGAVALCIAVWPKGGDDE